MKRLAIVPFSNKHSPGEPDLRRRRARTGPVFDVRGGHDLGAEHGIDELDVAGLPFAGFLPRKLLNSGQVSACPPVLMSTTRASSKSSSPSANAVRSHRSRQRRRQGVVSCRVDVAMRQRFSEQFRKWCDDAGLPPECSFHGLRKTALTRLAEAGCSANEIAAISGHATLKEIARYTKAADQRPLAREAMAKTVGGFQAVRAQGE
jgi:Phage integrase family